MKVATIYFNDSLDKTEVKWSDDFVVSHWVTRMDALQDILAIVEDAQNYVREQKTELDNDGYLPTEKS